MVKNCLTIKGADVAAVEQFLKDYRYDSHAYNLPLTTEVDIDDHGDGVIDLTYTQRTPHWWLEEVRKKYPGLKFKLVWQDSDEMPCCGIDDYDGVTYEIGDEDDLKLACRLLKEHQAKHSPPRPTMMGPPISLPQIPGGIPGLPPMKMVPQPIGPQIEVVQIHRSLYRELKYNLAINREMECTGYFPDPTKLIVVPLIPELQEVCRSYGLVY